METGPSCWWDESWNVSSGCLPIPVICDNCYAAQQVGGLHQAAGANREVRALYKGIVEPTEDGRWRFNGEIRVLPPDHRTWIFPLMYQPERPVLGPGMPGLLFVNDMSDLFYRQPLWVFHQIVDTIAASRHIGLILSRRVRRMSAYFCAPPSSAEQCWREHFWIGTSCAHQAEFNDALPHMLPLAERGYIIFLSLAPLLGPITLPPELLKLGDRAWVIASGEQGRHEFCRGADLVWYRRLRDQCAEAGVAFFAKQLPRKAAIPLDLMRRDFPRVERAPWW
jgi:protein gp37